MPSSARALASGPGVDGAARRRARQRARARAPSRRRRPRRRARPRRAAASARFAAASEWRPATTGRRARPAIRFAIDAPRASAGRRLGRSRARARRRARGVEPIASASSRAVSSAAVGLDREDDEVDAAHGVVVGRAPRAPSAAAASRARSASREPITTSSPASTRRFATARPKLPGAADDGDPHAARRASAVSASRRDARRRRSSASARRPAALRGGPVGVGLVDDERVDEPRVAARHVLRRRAARHPREHTVCGALHRAAADQRADGDARARGGARAPPGSRARRGSARC